MTVASDRPNRTSMSMKSVWTDAGTPPDRSSPTIAPTVAGSRQSCRTVVDELLRNPAGLQSSEIAFWNCRHEHRDVDEESHVRVVDVTI